MNSKLIFSFIVFFLSILISSKLIGQTTAGLPVIRAMNTIETLSTRNISSSPGSFMPGMPMSKPDVVGDPYLNKTWNSIAIAMYNSDNLLEGYVSKLDLLNDELDIYFPSGLRTIKGDRIKSFVWSDSISGKISHFVNGREFSRDDLKFEGFYEVVVEGNISLLKRTMAVIHYSDYNEVLQIGRRDHLIKHYLTNYYFIDGTLNEIPKTVKKLLPIFGDQDNAMKNFIKENGLSLDQPHHLEAIFIHFNKL